MADNRHDDQTDDEDTNDRKKHANWRRNPRVRQSGEGSVFKVERTLPSGNQRVAYRAVQRIKLPNGKSLRVAGEGSSPQEAREALYRNRVKRQIALGELPPEAMGDHRSDALRCTVGLARQQERHTRAVKICVRSEDPQSSCA